MELHNYQMTNQFILFVIAFEATHTIMKFANVPTSVPFVNNIDKWLKSTIEGCCQMFSNNYIVDYKNKCYFKLAD